MLNTPDLWIFIILAYGATAIVLLGLLAVSLRQYRNAMRQLHRLEESVRS
jgi:heme exporter protein CcmD